MDANEPFGATKRKYKAWVRSAFHNSRPHQELQRSSITYSLKTRKLHSFQYGSIASQP